MYVREYQIEQKGEERGGEGRGKRHYHIALGTLIYGRGQSN
jgi:hypothetical protein